MKTIFLDSFKEGIKRGAIYILFSFFLTRPLVWCQILGVLLSSSWSVYMASVYKFMPWQNYSNLIFNLLYLTTSYQKQKPLPSLEIYFADKNPARSSGRNVPHNNFIGQNI